MSDKELTLFAKRLSGILPDMMGEFTKGQKNELTRGIISLPQMTILQYLYRKDTCIMSDIANLISVSMSAATGLTDRMIKNKLLKRSRSIKDRRVVKMTITRRGRKVARSVMLQQYKMIKKMFGKISKEERRKYLGILKKVHKGLITERTQK
ncbi:MAG: MarR family transcriptional regulator [Candidatus Omnitrophota bacterium]|nr:MAG: MarR family transcriptional regulator [Candidatus Omnitrophota bacterium]